MIEALLSRPERKLIYYHNITPASFFEPYDPGVATVMDKARDELRGLCAHVSTAMANSEYSARELRGLGVPDVTVVPPYLPPELTAEVDESHAGWLRSTKRGIDVLFVGRVVPNKGHLHLLRAFAALRASAPGSRLFVVGMWGPTAYMGAIQRLRENLGSEGIAFTGSITEASLAAHYREADVYVCLSEHEGFGLPLIEAMRAGVPVVAYDAGAVAETLGGSAVLIRTLDPRVIAEVVARVASDEDLRKELIRRQYDRVAELENVPRDEAIVECVSAAAR
jgi:glycosyltransferase involved in cell wall biosynthesis